jgi:hypothetical protein
MVIVWQMLDFAVVVRVRSGSGSGCSSRLVTSHFFGCSIGRFAARNPNVRWDPADLNLPYLVAELIECSYGFNQDELS